MTEMLRGELEPENGIQDKECEEALIRQQIEAQRDADANKITNQNRLNVFLLGEESERAIETVWAELSEFIEKNPYATSEEVRLKLEESIQKMKGIRGTYLRERVLQRLTKSGIN